MDESGSGGLIVAILFFAFIFGGFGGNSSKYQVVPCGSDNIMILDVNTGEAWTKGNGEENSNYLVPISYRYEQYSLSDYGIYSTPEETRSDSNVSWGTYIKRKFQKSNGKVKR